MTSKTIYTPNGTVPPKNTYIIRQADNDLLDFCRVGEFVHILCPRQVGKSSLMVRTANVLQKHNIRTAIVDLSKFGTEIQQEQWFLGILTEISEALALNIDLIDWWRKNNFLGETQKLSRFFSEIVLSNLNNSIVIFFDEIDTTLGIKFADDFFAAIRSLYNARATTPSFQRLSFVFIGTATPNDFIKNSKRTPFNVGRRLDLEYFSFDEALPLADGLDTNKEKAHEILRWIFEWTNGHPYLTQRFCYLLSQKNKNINEKDVNTFVQSEFLRSQDSNLQFVRDMLLVNAKNTRAVMKLYLQVLNNQRVADSEQSINKSHLKLSGVVKIKDNFYTISNKIYEEAFNIDWVKKNLPQPRLLTIILTQIIVAVFLFLGYIVFSEEPLYILFAVYLFINFIWVKRREEVFDRLQALIIMPSIFVKDTNPQTIPFYPRSFMEDIALGFRDLIKQPLTDLIKVLSNWLSQLASLIYSKDHPFRTVGYLFMFVSFLFFVLIDAISVANTLVVLDLWSGTLPEILSRFDIALFGGSLMSLIVGMLLIFEARTSESEFTTWSERDQPTKRLALGIALLVTLLSLLTLIAWALFRLIELGRLNTNPFLDGVLNWVLFGLVPINGALAAAITFLEALRGFLVTLVLLGWIVIGILYLINYLITNLGYLIPFMADIIYRMLYFIIDITQWFILTPIYLIRILIMTNRIRS